NPNSSGQLTLDVKSVSVRGTSYAVDATVESMDTVMKGRGVTKADAAKVGGGAVAGALVGKLLGKNAKGAVIGGAVGAAAGAAAGSPWCAGRRASPRRARHARRRPRPGAPAGARAGQPPRPPVTYRGPPRSRSPDTRC